MADRVFALLCLRSLTVITSGRLVRRGESVGSMGIEMWRKTLGIVGLGRIGKLVARRACGSEMEVLPTTG